MVTENIISMIRWIKIEWKEIGREEFVKKIIFVRV